MLLELLIVVVLAVHLLAMNLASAGPLMCIWLRGITGEPGSLRGRLGLRLAWWSLAAMIVGIVTGLGLILAPPSVGLHEAMGRFPVRAYWFAGAELAFSLGCLVVYVLSWNRMRRWRWFHAFWAVLSATNLLYHFPPLMIVLAKLAANAAWSEAAMIDRSTFLPLMVRGEVLSLSTHFGLASLAVAAVAVLGLLARQKDGESNQNALRHVARIAALIALLASVPQLPVGFWVLSTMPSASRDALMGGNILSSLLFAGGVMATMLLLHRLVDVAMGGVNPRNLQCVGWLLLVVVLLMTATSLTASHGHAVRAISTLNEKSRGEVASTAYELRSEQA